jgi:hypothetical protein
MAHSVAEISILTGTEVEETRVAIALPASPEEAADSEEVEALGEAVGGAE